MESSFLSQIQSLEKQLQDSFAVKSEKSHAIDSQKSPQNSQNSSKLVQMMKIFINSLKLNQKLYNSIVQKQAKISSGTNSFFHISAQTDQKIQDTLKRTKQLYEDTVHQNQKARFMLQQFLTPIRQEIRSKVDETTFTLQMKMLLDEYDVMGHQISYDVTEQQKVKEEKRKSINSQTLSFLKDKILPVLSHIEQRLQKNIENGSIVSEKIEELDGKINHLESEINIQKDTVEKIEKKNLQLANEKMDGQNFDKKIRQDVRFLIKEYSTQIQGIIEKINRFAKNLQGSFTNQLETIKSSLSSFSTNHKASENFLKNQIQKHQNKISEQSNFLQQKNIELSAIQKELKAYHDSLKPVVNLQTKFKDLEQKLEKGHFKNQNQLKGPQFQNLIKRLQEFDKESRKIKQFEKDSEERIMIMKGQLQGIRDILSKKANFSDILLHIQNKVDKREIKELKMKLFEYDKEGISEMKNNSMLMSKQSETNRSWKKRHIKSRSFFSPSPAQKAPDNEFQHQQVKRFKLGFNHEFLLSNDMLQKQLSKTQYLRKSLINYPSNAQKSVTQI